MIVVHSYVKLPEDRWYLIYGMVYTFQARVDKYFAASMQTCESIGLSNHSSLGDKNQGECKSFRQYGKLG
jgi:ABC-type sulfate transport system permease subunit